MTSSMRSKLFEEVNRLAEQFSRLTLSDDNKRSSISNEFKVLTDDKVYNTKVEKSISMIMNNEELTGPKEISTNASEIKNATANDKTTSTAMYAEPLIEDVNKGESYSEQTSCLIISSPVSEGIFCKSQASTCKNEILSTDIISIDESTMDKTACTIDYNLNVHGDAHSSNYASTLDNELLLANTFKKHNAESGDKTPKTKFDTGSSPKDSILRVNKFISTNIVKDIVETVSDNTISTLESLSQDIILEDKETQPTNPIGINAGSDKTTFSKFYAVALPKDADHPEDLNTLIYTEFKDVLSAVKSYKGSRFKEFAKKEDALQFASLTLERAAGKVKAEDDGSTLRSATSQELCQLRKCIERGDEINFVNTVWSNPKILVGTCDTPSIMQEGMRYNALHIAAKSNKPYLCQLILDTIENPKFLLKIYPSKTDTEREKIVCRLLDLYINTPDKKTGDTPLHYASKFGCIDCVKILLSHPLCIPDRRNIAGFTPREIICNRLQPKSISLIEGIEEAFKGLLYIPVLRSEENDVPPTVGKPCTCKKIIESTRGSELKDSTSILSLKAFVGPMSPGIAEQFYLVLKKPSSSQVFFYNPEELKLISKIRYGDRENGLERIGRWLAEDLNVQWQEYFPFLDTFTNLASDEGRRSLETHLKKCQLEHHMPYASNEELSVYLVHQYPSHINPLAHYVNVHLEHKREKEDDSKYDEIYCTPPSSPIKNRDEDCFITPPGSPSQYVDDAVFLQGSCLSKLDVDVFLALSDTPVDARVYPNVSKWKSLVKSKLKDSEKTKFPCVDSISLLTSVYLPRLHLSEKICTPKKTLLNKAFCLESSN